MSFLCKLGIHNGTKIKTETEKNKKEKGACIETWEETFNHYKCKRCGKEKKKLNKYRRNAHAPLRKDRNLVKREWLNDTNGENNE